MQISRFYPANPVTAHVPHVSPDFDLVLQCHSASRYSLTFSPPMSRRARSRTSWDKYIASIRTYRCQQLEGQSLTPKLDSRTRHCLGLVAHRNLMTTIESCFSIPSTQIHNKIIAMLDVTVSKSCVSHFLRPERRSLGNASVLNAKNSQQSL